jgi:hypothetical protein
MTKIDLAIGVAAAALGVAVLVSGAHAQPFQHGACRYNPRIDAYSPDCHIGAPA